MKLAKSFLIFLFFLACSSSLPIQKERFEERKSTRTFPETLKKTWKAIEKSVEGLAEIEREPKEVETDKDWNELTSRTLTTGWIFTRSRDRFVEYKVDQTPHRIMLESRLRWKITATRQIAGTDVRIETFEEVQEIDHTGKALGYKSVHPVDTRRHAEMLDKINISLLSLPNTDSTP